VRLLAGFFRRLFKNSNNNRSEEIDSDTINNVADEIMTEELIRNQPSVTTNKLPDITENITAGDINGISRCKFYASSHIGRVKKSNQDSIFTADLKCHTNGRVVNLALGIVADGMGGLSMGEVASITAINSATTFLYTSITEYFEHGLPNSEEILISISNALQNANALVKHKGDELEAEIGTTFTVALLIGNIAYFGHVGDSRAYIADTKANTIEKVTRDHSLVGYMIEIGQLTEREAKRHPRRNEIYRTLGVLDTVEIDTYCRTIDDNSVIVLVSDGLWGFVDDSEILKEIVKSRELSGTAETLVQMANEGGGKDNISIVIMKPDGK
jgi:PPM family protein phosphatase